MYHTGIGCTQVNSFLAGLNIPGIHPKSLAQREKEVAPAFNDVATRSCDDALNKEVEAVINIQRYASSIKNGNF